MGFLFSQHAVLAQTFKEEIRMMLFVILQQVKIEKRILVNFH